MAGHPIRVTEAWLRQCCAGSPEQLSPARAYYLAAKLKNLAPWWLRPKVLQQAALHATELKLDDAARQWNRSPQLPTDPGACWIAVINKYPAELALLRPAWALPLRWWQGKHHDPRLPAGLLALADEVRRELERLGEVVGQWGLLPGSPRLLDGLDLSSLEGHWHSAWVPLAVGLLLAAWEGQPDRTLWATGQWVPTEGIRPVEGLQAKLALAHSFGARAFFAPESQTEDLRAWARTQAPTVDILPLLQSTFDLPAALDLYLEQLDLPIGRGQHLKAKRAAHFNRIRDTNTAQRFYRKHVLPDVIEDLRQRLPPDLLAGEKKLVTIVSKGFDLVTLAVQVIQPADCLLLHDRELAESAHDHKAAVQQQMPGAKVTACLVEGSTREELLAAFRRQIEQFAPQEPPQNLVFDLTSGKRIMNLALYDAIPPASHVICVQADQHDGRPVPYTEQVHAWRKA